MAALGNCQGSNGGAYEINTTVTSDAPAQGSNGSGSSHLSLSVTDPSRLTYIHSESHPSGAGVFIPLSPDGGARG
jgi:hypothetical protein